MKIEAVRTPLKNNPQFKSCVKSMETLLILKKELHEAFGMLPENINDSIQHGNVYIVYGIFNDDDYETMFSVYKYKKDALKYIETFPPRNVNLRFKNEMIGETVEYKYNNETKT